MQGANDIFVDDLNQWLLTDLTGDGAKEIAGHYYDRARWVPFIEGMVGPASDISAAATLPPVLAGDLTGDGVNDLVAGRSGALAVTRTLGVLYRKWRHWPLGGRSTLVLP